MSLSVLRQDVIISRQVEVAIVICINHIREAVHPIAAHHIAINHPAVHLRVVQAARVQAVVTIINQIQQISHHIAAAQRKVQRQRRVHMILMMMAKCTDKSVIFGRIKSNKRRVLQRGWKRIYQPILIRYFISAILRTNFSHPLIF